MLADFPTVTFDEVFHVGTLNPEDRKSASYEGDGISVSLHPDEWARIARLGGPTQVMTKPSGQPFQFVLWHDLITDNIDALRVWAVEQGWMEQRTAYRISWFDDEWDDTFSMEFTTEAEALAEAEDRGDEDACPVTPVTVWRPTDMFPEARVERDADPTDTLLAVYVRRTRPDLDGVWWEDTFDPMRLSCPRGVLVRDLDQYAVTEVLTR